VARASQDRAHSRNQLTSKMQSRPKKGPGGELGRIFSVFLLRSDVRLLGLRVCALLGGAPSGCGIIRLTSAVHHSALVMLAARSIRWRPSAASGCAWILGVRNFLDNQLRTVFNNYGLNGMSATKQQTIGRPSCIRPFRLLMGWLTVALGQPPVPGAKKKFLPSQVARHPKQFFIWDHFDQSRLNFSSASPVDFFFFFFFFFRSSRCC